MPFEPAVDRNDDSGSTAAALDRLVQSEASEGWDFVSLANHSTLVPGSRGCFGFGSSDPYPKTMSVAVFRR
ncbi:MAG TPA: hypothetical protein VJ994_14800 [Paracoccaceae bacterium]|nr:hypothetical protein [Paracoccaceae bacterium]